MRTHARFENGILVKNCFDCGQILPIKNFGVNGTYRKKQKYKPRCHQCEENYNNERFYRYVFECVGGKENYKCAECGYHRYVGALEFHHINPQLKDHAISLMQNYSRKSIKTEIEKCILLCCICHREVHGGKRQLTSLVNQRINIQE